jgi:hypothetical protein
VRDGVSKGDLAMMDYEHEINSLAAETLAIQTLLTHVLGRLAQADPQMYAAIKAGFDDAASDAENTAIKFGKTASPHHIVKALGIIEALRTATLGNPDKPKHGV